MAIPRFPTDQTFNIAKIKMGKSIEEFISIRKVPGRSDKDAVEFYPRKRFMG